MIEGGNAGGSALAQANQRRATADRLIAEATWLERVANDERQMAAQLLNLPTAYSILHDLRVPGSKGNIDHVVVGPGGAFLVVTRRYAQSISYKADQLFAGDTSLRGDLDSARVESQLLTQTLGTPVVPVIGLLGSVLPATVPQQLAGVLICAGDNVARVITRSPHTLLTPTKVADAAERAMPLLNTPGSSTRTMVGPPPELLPPASFGAQMPTPSLSADTEQGSRRAAPRGESPAELIAVASTTKGKRAVKKARTPKGKLVTAKEKAAATGERSGRARSAGFVAALLVSLCLIAIAVGSLVRVLGSNWPGSTAAAGVSTSTSVAGTGVDTVPAVAPAAPGALTFSTACPQPGAGWQLVPGWPGDRTGLVAYDLETLNPDGTWQLAASMSSAATVANATLLHEPSNSAVTARITVVMADGGRAIGSPVTVNTPVSGC